MRRILVVFLAMSLLLCGCTALEPQEKQYTATFLDLFDTVTTVVGFAESEEAFREQAQKIHDELLAYHRLFDIYNEYEGIGNLKTINDRAGISPVTVDGAIIELLLDCRQQFTQPFVPIIAGRTAAKVNGIYGDSLSQRGSLTDMSQQRLLVGIHPALLTSK